MNYKVIRDIPVRIWEGPYLRTAFVASAALILLTASLVRIGQLSAAGAAAEIRATGTFTSAVSDPIAQYTPAPGNLSILSRYNLITWTGSLEGTGLSLQTITRDDVEAKKAWLTNIATFFGTLAGSDPGTRIQGSFSFIAHVVADRRNLNAPIPSHGKVVVVEGTGLDGLEGICGGGTFVNPGSGVAAYDFTFRFGEDCKANN